MNTDQIGSVFQCECGQTLFACLAASYREIPVRCQSCRESYLADPEDIGESFECECGADIVVRDVVLQLPIARDGEATTETVEVTEEGENKRADSTSESQGFGIAVEANDSIASSSSRDSKKTGKLASRIVPVGGAVAAVALFAAAVVMFLRRDAELPATTDAGRGVAASPTAVATKASLEVTPSEESNDSELADANVVAKMLRTIPTPKSASALGDGSTRDAMLEDVSADAEPTDTRSPFGARTKRPNHVLPERSVPRKVIPLVKVKRRFNIFDHAYQQAFESYETFTSIEDTESQEYATKLGETLFLLQHAYTLAQKNADDSRLHELTYLMAYLLHRAGHLVDSSIFAEAAARWGDANDPSTREAMMIALAALQEAATIHWGDPAQVGELNQMRTLAELFDVRWPNDPQRDEIWLTLAQNYSVFNQPLASAKAYAEVTPDSPHHASAQLAAGSEYWNHFIERASDDSPDPEEMVSLLKASAQHLRVAKDLLAASDEDHAEQLITARLTLAKIADRLGDFDAVIQLIEGDAPPLPDAIPPLPDAILTGPGNEQRKSQTARTVWMLLYRAKSSKSNVNGAAEVLERISELPSDPSDESVNTLYLGIVRDQIRILDRKQTIRSEDIETLTRLMQSLRDSGGEIETATSLWFAESWTKIASKCKDPADKRTCFIHAADWYRDVVADGKLSGASRNAALLRHAEILRNAGRLEDSLAAIVRILHDNPNALDLQFQAAMTLQQITFEGGPINHLAIAISGPDESKRESDVSAVWGWEQIVRFLYKLRYSANGTPGHAEQLAEAQFHLARSRWILSTLLGPTPRSEELTEKTKAQLKILIATMPEDDPSTAPWRKRFETILTEIE